MWTFRTEDHYLSQALGCSKPLFRSHTFTTTTLCYETLSQARDNVAVTTLSLKFKVLERLSDYAVGKDNLPIQIDL